MLYNIKKYSTTLQHKMEQNIEIHCTRKHSKLQLTTHAMHVTQQPLQSTVKTHETNVIVRLHINNGMTVTQHYKAKHMDKVWL